MKKLRMDTLLLIGLSLLLIMVLVFLSPFDNTKDKNKSNNHYVPSQKIETIIADTKKKVEKEEQKKLAEQQIEVLNEKELEFLAGNQAMDNERRILRLRKRNLVLLSEEEMGQIQINLKSLLGLEAEMDITDNVFYERIHQALKNINTTILERLDGLEIEKKRLENISNNNEKQK